MPAHIYHNHHIIPKHAGGADDPSNIVKLTIPEHAEAHRLLWEQYGRLGDKMAWLMLSGKTEEGEQVRIELCRAPEARKKISEANMGRKKSSETCARLSTVLTGRIGSRTGQYCTSETKLKMSESAKGRKLTETYRAKLSQSHMGHKHSAETKRKMSQSH